MSNEKTNEALQLKQKGLYQSLIVGITNYTTHSIPPGQRRYSHEFYSFCDHTSSANYTYGCTTMLTIF